LGVVALDGALQTDDCRQPEGGDELDEVPAALRGAAEQRVGKPGFHAAKLLVRLWCCDRRGRGQRVDLMTCAR
jgi:hypothetical protein